MNVPLLWHLPANVLQTSVEIMRPHGSHGNEGLALWLGRAEDNVATVTHVIAPIGPGFHTTPLHLRLSFGALSRLTELAGSLNTYLVGQIHSHPGLFLNLSAVDEEFGVRSQGYLSVVCPFYAQRPISSVNACGVHVFDEQRYRRLEPREVRRRVHVLDATAEVIQLEMPE